MSTTLTTGMRLLTKIILFLLLILPHTLKAQMARLYTMQQGLPTTHISGTYVDEDGLLWLMGERALAFFDGNQFHSVFDSRSDIAIRTNLIYSMLQIGEYRYFLGTGFGLYDFDSRTNTFTQVSLGEPSGENAMPGYPVSSITLINGGKSVLATTSGFGATVIDIDSRAVNEPLTQRISAAIEDKFVYASYADMQGCLWVATSVDPLLRIDVKTLKPKPVSIADDLRNRINNGCPIVAMCEDKKTHNILLGAPGIGLLVYDKATNVVRETHGNTPSIAPRSIISTKMGDLFVGTDNAGIISFDRATESTNPVHWAVPGLDMDVSKVHHLTEDSDGNLIATLYQSGVMIVPSHINKMTYIPISRTANGINSSPVACLLHHNGTYWIGTDGSGMFRSSNHRFDAMEAVSDGLNLKQMTSIAADNSGRIWASSYGGGVQMWNGTQWTTPAFVQELSSQAVLSLAHDAKTNHLYVCVNGSGLYDVDIDGQTTTKMDVAEIGNRWVSHALIDNRRNLWVVYATGLCRIDLATGKAQSMSLTNIANTQINDMAEMGDKVFFGTSNGLASYSPKTGEIDYEDINSQLAEVNIKSLLPVGKNLWVATSQSVACLSNGLKNVLNYTSFPGFYIGELNQRSRMIGTEDFVCFGGDNGVLAISTINEPSRNHIIDKLMFTGLSVDGKPVVFDPTIDDNILKESILATDVITLNPDQNTFSVNFGTVELAHGDDIVYMYTLEGHEDAWHEAHSNSAVASYSSVPPGCYTLKVKARFNYSDEWVERSISVVIQHPWYATCWAIAVYIILAVLLAWYIYQLWNERHKERVKVRQLQHTEQIKEAKLRLFTSIAHELRTPLTMIISPLKQLKTSDSNAERHTLYDVMQRNCDRLLNIVKQITDIRKLDNGQLALHFSEFDFVSYCTNILDSFKGIAAAKDIDLQHFAEGKAMIWADEVHLEKVLINLLSNAFKFTPQGGQVLVKTSVGKSQLRCSVYNSGSHIDDADLDHIFERFYQGRAATDIAGSGIGLNLTYELMKLHHGNITVQNADPDGVEFVFTLPLGKDHLTAAELKPRDTDDSASQNEQNCNHSQIATLEQDIATAQSLEKQDGEEARSKRSLLIVDDDREICEYMRSQLEGDYNITICFSGNAAWKHVLSARPDVVVTDLVMADGNGIELCNNIKHNAETAHIPVIMLTAESDEQSHLMSIGAEVDCYLTKPFNIDIVRGALSQVLRVRENLLNKANRAEIQHDYEEVEMDSYEDKFFTKVNEVIKHNMDDSNFTVETLAREVGISRVHLNRKLKERYGLSPNAFIRGVRLKQAAYLLVNRKVTISEVAYKVGFASHSYFTNNFHDYFGMTPTEFVTYYSDEANEEQFRKLLE